MSDRRGGTLVGRALRWLRGDSPDPPSAAGHGSLSAAGNGSSAAEAGGAGGAEAVIDPAELVRLRQELVEELDRLAARTAGEAPAPRS
jgi:hypothetical protein